MLIESLDCVFVCIASCQHLISYRDVFFNLKCFLFVSVTRVPVQSTQPPPGIVELDGEKFTLQW